jgi:hypothetical protein
MMSSRANVNVARIFLCLYIGVFEVWTISEVHTLVRSPLPGETYGWSLPLSMLSVLLIPAFFGYVWGYCKRESEEWGEDV